MNDIIVLFTTPAYSLTQGDPAIINGNLCMVRAVDDDRDDIEEILVTVENLSDPAGETEFTLNADDVIEIWESV